MKAELKIYDPGNDEFREATQADIDRLQAACTILGSTVDDIARLTRRSKDGLAARVFQRTVRCTQRLRPATDQAA